MLITSLLPLLGRYSLGFDLVAGADGTVTLTVMPRKAEGARHALETDETRPIVITAKAEEIDAELARGSEGALGQIFVARRALAEQLADQRQAAEEASAAAAKKAPAKPAGKGSAAPAAPKAEPQPDGPAKLW